MPLAVFGGFVEVRADQHGGFHFLKLGSEIKVVRGVVDRIRSENQKGIHFAGVDIGAKLGEGFQLIHGIGFDGLRVVERRADVSESGVDGVRQGMYFRGLEFTGDDKRSATMLR